ncbi:ECF RNA polymerase sigma factor SigK [Gordonia shandongensis]|uniref:ECF RNA polymerase sigma factor SigK n=1 Tax=Gordonia shandongensis TaxID=376351 RepID=UPI001FE00AC5|nr:ECF RNA polymerase sigma factor SigK [Gordonia shandongensis]
MRTLNDSPPGQAATPEDLLVAVAAGDRSAYTELFDTLGPRTLGLARRVVGSRARSEEVFQEAWLQVWRTASSYDPARGSASAWITTLVHRRAVDTVRHDVAEHRRDERFESARAPAFDSVSDDVVARDERTRVRACLETLTTRQREAIDRAYFGGLTYREVATSLAVNPATIKTRIRDGLERLRTCMGGVIDG